MHPKDADRMANSVDIDQMATAPLGAVWSGSTLFAHVCLPENWVIKVFSIFCSSVLVQLIKPNTEN